MLSSLWQDVVVSPVALSLPSDMTYERWNEIGKSLAIVERGAQWWIGDWLRYGEHTYGEKYKRAEQVTGYDQQTLRNFKWVSGEYAVSCRQDNLSWNHYLSAASLEPSVRTEMLRSAADNGWSVSELRLQINRIQNSPANLEATTCTVDDLRTLATSGAHFGTVYADPPWLYDNQGTRAATGNHYMGMSVAEIADLPIAQLAAEDAHLHLWTTNAFLFDTVKIFDSWGFDYKGAFVWVKPQMGIGNYWRVSHEFLLLGTRGSAPFRDKSQKSWLEAERTKHSAKPEKIRKLIERVSPGPYLELFGRRVADGWTVWGNQIERSMFDGSVRAIA